MDDGTTTTAAATGAAATTGETAGAAIEWLLFAVVVVVPYLAWFPDLGDPPRLNPYTLFPLLGLWAWSLMWVHYAHGTLRRLVPGLGRSDAFHRWSGWLVLTLILLHPGLLLGAMTVDTELGPARGPLVYAGESGRVAVIAGAVALMAFCAFEVLVRLAQRPSVQRRWRWVSLSQVVAMTLIWFHGLALGRHLGDGGLRTWWFVLGVLYVPCAAVVLRADWRSEP